jgi:hypothetical protein
MSKASSYINQSQTLNQPLPAARNLSEALILTIAVTGITKKLKYFCKVKMAEKDIIRKKY